jgi:hypothetical protein
MATNLVRIAKSKPMSRLEMPFRLGDGAVASFITQVFPARNPGTYVPLFGIESLFSSPDSAAHD